MKTVKGFKGKKTLKRKRTLMRDSDSDEFIIIAANKNN